MTNNTPRVRFAPSPTGQFHVGSARTALFNYLFAKQNDGAFILRIENTDKKRSKKEYEEDILDSLEWMGIDIDEGPNKGGDYGPYKQSKRNKIYQDTIKRLMEEDKAYPCFCSKEELEKERKKQKEEGKPPRYSGKCREISKEKAQQKIENGEDFILRLKVDKDQTITFEDKIRGEVEVNTNTIGDFSIAKNLKDPLYNLACVIDDSKMEITDVIRGEDHIPNTPKQILLYRALDREEAIPNFTHLPLILAPDKSKLSKRHGAVAVQEYKAKGYLPESFVNFIALIGWNPGDDREIFTLEELIDTFSINRCHKSGAVFDKDKLQYINTKHLKKADPNRLGRLIIPHLIKANLLHPEFAENQYPPALGGKAPKTTYKAENGKEFSFKELEEIAKVHQDRLEVLSEITEVADFFFVEINTSFELLQWKEMSRSELKDSFDKSIEILSNIKKWNREELTEKLLEEANKLGDRGKFLWPLRAALTGREESAGPFEVAHILGQERSIKRLKQAKNSL